jgi:hypothetical protein
MNLAPGHPSARSDRDVLDEVLENVRLLIRSASMRPAAESGTITPIRAFFDDSVIASLVDIWLASFNATETDSLSPDEREQLRAMSG